MARSYLLDTSILSHLVRQPQGPVAVRIAEVGEDKLLTSIIVASELRYGAARRGGFTRRLPSDGPTGLRPLLRLAGFSVTNLNVPSTACFIQMHTTDRFPVGPSSTHSTRWEVP